jgi:hypothetical protein
MCALENLDWIAIELFPKFEEPIKIQAIINIILQVQPVKREEASASEQTITTTTSLAVFKQTSGHPTNLSVGEDVMVIEAMLPWYKKKSSTMHCPI